MFRSILFAAHAIFSQKYSGQTIWLLLIFVKQEQSIFNKINGNTMAMVDIDVIKEISL